MCAGAVQADEGTELRRCLVVECVSVMVVCGRIVGWYGCANRGDSAAHVWGIEDSYPLGRRGAAVAAFIVAIGFGELEELEGESRSGAVSVCCPRLRRRRGGSGRNRRWRGDDGIPWPSSPDRPPTFAT